LNTAKCGPSLTRGMVHIAENVNKVNNNTFLVDRTIGRAYATVLRPSVVCDVMYCG